MTIEPISNERLAEIRADAGHKGHWLLHLDAIEVRALLSRLDKAEAGWQDERPILADYTNWRGERSTRTFIPRRVFWGSNEWHPEPQVLIEAYDCEKEALRTFAAAGFARTLPGSES